MSVFDPYLRDWQLVPDGKPVVTAGSDLLPVRQAGVAAMLKVARHDEERYGGHLMMWWNGDGAARVLAYDRDALLLERASGPLSLAQMVRQGDDARATRILCATVARLHAPRPWALPDLIALEDWFHDLWPAAAGQGGLLGRCARTARGLLAMPRQVGVLHGDIHHGNVLDFGARGWLAIDPKRLHGERGFDYANLFCNPSPGAALAQGRFERRLDIVAGEAGLERHRLLQWILAWAGLSAIWRQQDGADAAGTLQVAERAAAALAASASHQ
ncbi:aminoglycoside phosphotransferase family protein [Bordetella sp. BOR01]|uniref:aminoglycoside phosphotransferase family protein n=1 Tax=Bordetella sp. BOR01 TaxID=2854779 RepID=UPI00351CDE52